MTSYRTGANPYESAIFSNNVSTLDELWSKPIGAGGTFGSPVVAAGKVYVGSESKRLYAFDQLTGATVPGFPKVLPAGVQSTPVVTHNVATKAPDNKLYGFNATTGKPVAGYPKSLQGPVLLPLTAAYGNVYALAAGINKLYGYKVAGGGTVTGFPKTLPVAVSQPPVIGYGSIFLTAADHQLYGYNATTGAALANLPFDYQASGAVAPIIAAGMVLVGDGASAVLGVDAHGPAFMGQVVNKTDVLRNFTGAPLYSNGNIGVAVHTDVAKQLLPGISLYNAVNNLSTGSFVSPGEVNLSSPIVANGVYYVATGQWVHAFYTTQPQPVWSHHVSTGIFSTPVVSNGILHVASTDGKLYAFSPLGLPPGAASPKAPSLAKLAAAVRATRR
jgi:outer membrane protein assembly factor BamB